MKFFHSYISIKEYYGSNKRKPVILFYPNILQTRLPAFNFFLAYEEMKCYKQIST